MMKTCISCQREIEEYCPNCPYCTFPQDTEESTWSDEHLEDDDWQYGKEGL